MLTARHLLPVIALATCAQLLASESAADAVRIDVPYTAPGEGFISLGIEDAQGRLVRNLIHAEEVKGGAGTVVWDGTSDLGVPQPAGSYTTRAIYWTEPVQADYVTTLGKDGNPPYRTPDGKGGWGGNLGEPGPICANSSDVLMVWTCVEDSQVTGIQRMDRDGNIIQRYHSFYPWDRRTAAAMDDRNIYLGIVNKGKKRLEIAAYDINESHGKIITELPTKPHQEEGETRWQGRFFVWMNGLALSKDRIYATIAQDDAFFVIERRSGKILKQLSVKKPYDVERRGDSLLLIRDGAVVELDADGTELRVLVKAGVLDEPSQLAVLPDGGFFVNGAKGQVARFDAGGKLVDRIGKAGGAPEEGHFDSQGIGDVKSMCIGPDGSELWIQDYVTGFQRTSRWSLDGRLSREWFCTRLDLWVKGWNPARPNEIVGTNHAYSDYPSIQAWSVDWDKQTWHPAWFYKNSWEYTFANRDVYLGHTHSQPLAKVRGNNDYPVFAWQGRTFVSNGGFNYFMNETGNGEGVVFQYSADAKPKPVAMVGFHHAFKDKETGRYKGDYDAGPNEWICWADRNRDGKMSDDEITHTVNPTNLAAYKRVREARIDADLTVHLQMNPKQAGGALTHITLKPKEILAGGIPVYDWAQIQEQPLESPDLRGGDGSKEVRSLGMPPLHPVGDSLIGLMRPGCVQELKLPGIDGTGWWAGRNWRNKLIKFDAASGRIDWMVGRRAPAVAKPGEMYHPADYAGRVGDVHFVVDTIGPVWLWHDSGLFVGHIFRDNPAGESGRPVANVVNGELQSTRIINHPNGRNYHLMSGGELRIHEITVPRFTALPSKRISLSSDQAELVQAWDPDGLPPTEKPTFVAHRQPAGQQGMGPVKVDGKRDGREGWNRVGDERKQPMLIMKDGETLGEVFAMYDDNNLYLSYDVYDPNTPINKGTELPYCPFVSGAYVDFKIAPDWSQPQREAVQEGDVRVIISEISGQKQIYQQGFWQKKQGGSNPQTITSPVAEVRFDHIGAVPGLQVAYKAGKYDDRLKRNRYLVELAVPLKSLGISAVAGQKIGFDASIAIATEGGAERQRACSWAGASEGAVVDRPGSAILLPQTWGTLVLGK